MSTLRRIESSMGWRKSTIYDTDHPIFSLVWNQTTKKNTTDGWLASLSGHCFDISVFFYFIFGSFSLTGESGVQNYIRSWKKIREKQNKIKMERNESNTKSLRSKKNIRLT